jgi:hypothetical protein
MILSQALRAWLRSIRPCGTEELCRSGFFNRLPGSRVERIIRDEDLAADVGFQIGGFR